MHDHPAMAKMESNIRLVDGAGRQHGGRELAGEAAEWGGGYRFEAAMPAKAAGTFIGGMWHAR
ncbi:hypothetical protein NCCP2165_23870 [Halomonas sp. NCCP-2165]|nr:hypothetical protein NCCP2165_23870 [Halomonas sp. NCCP-2165]